MRRSGEQRRDVAVDPGAEREVEAPQVVHPCLGVDIDPDLALREHRVVGVGRDVGDGGVRVAQVTPVQLAGIGQVLPDEAQVGIARMGVVDDPPELVLLHGVVRSVDRDPRLGSQRPGVLTDEEITAAYEHRRTADDLHVTEAHVPQVALGELPAHPDGSAVVQHRGDERVHAGRHGPQPVRGVVGAGLRADAGHDDRDLQLRDELGQPLELGLEGRPEGIGERNDESVVLLVDPLGGGDPGPDAVGDHLGPRRLKDLVRGIAEDQVA